MNLTTIYMFPRKKKNVLMRTARQQLLLQTQAFPVIPQADPGSSCRNRVSHFLPPEPEDDSNDDGVEPRINKIPIPAPTPIPTRTYAIGTERPIPIVVEDDNKDGENEEESIMDPLLEQQLV